MTNTNLAAMKALGQSVWLDSLGRDLIVSGELERRVRQGVSGVTSNPAIFEQAFTGTDIYDSDIRTLAVSGYRADAVYRELALRDVRAAVQVLSTVYEETDGADGFVSLEVSPHLAHDTAATIAEARDLWHALDRDNVMIKVPGTLAGLPAVTRLIAEGINVNVTLLFGLDRYRQVTDAFMAGLESRHDAGKDLHRVASVASFFLSRIDSLVDPKLEKSTAPQAAAARGQTAIACARLAYRQFESVIAGERFKKLALAGARPQRLLWASTGAKNPAYSDKHYVEPLVGPDTVNTMPAATLDAWLDHGSVAATLTRDVDKAEELLRRLPAWGVDLDAVTGQLEQEGIRKFVEPYDRLLQSISQKINAGKIASMEK